MPNSLFKYLSILLDAIGVNLAYILAFLIRFGGKLPAENFDAYLVMMPWLTGAYIFAGWVYGLYESERVESFWDVSRASFLAAVLGTLITAALAFLGGEFTSSFARWTIIISLAIVMLYYSGWRIFLLRLFPISYPAKRVLILGVNQTAADLARSLNERVKWGWHFVGYLEVDEQDQKTYKSNFELTQVYEDIKPGEILGSISELNELVTKHRINRLIVAAPVNIRSFIESIVLNSGNKLTIDVVPEFYEIFIGTTDSIVGDVPLMRVVTAHPSRYHSYIKRFGDIAGFFIVMLITVPVWVFAIIGSLLDDGFPIFYRQERVGKNKKNFDVFKFRTMVKDAETYSGPVLATEDDERITRFGRFLRLSRIDELPQLLNIIRGEMSFIGPRPERPSFVQEYLDEIPGYSERFKVKPGVTGLAQVNGGYATTPERKLKYDLMYIYNQSFSMDVQIVAETFKVILTGKGAQ